MHISSCHHTKCSQRTELHSFFTSFVQRQERKKTHTHIFFMYASLCKCIQMTNSISLASYIYNEQQHETAAFWSQQTRKLSIKRKQRNSGRKKTRDFISAIPYQKAFTGVSKCPDVNALVLCNFRWPKPFSNRDTS